MAENGTHVDHLIRDKDHLIRDNHLFQQRMQEEDSLQNQLRAQVK